MPQLLLSWIGASLMPVAVFSADFEVVHRQFAADHDRGPTDANPAPVDFLMIQQAGGVFQRHFLVAVRVEEADDFAIDADATGNPDIVAERPRDALGDARLAVSGGPEQEQTAAGIDGRPEAAKHRLVDQQVFEGVLQVGRFRVLGRQGLGRDTSDIVFQHDRRRAEVGASIGQAAGALVPGVRQLINVVVHQGGAFVNDQLFGFQLCQDLLDEQKRQLQLVGDLSPAGVAARGQQLDQQRLDLALGQARLGQRRGLERNEFGNRAGSRSGGADVSRLGRGRRAGGGDALDALQQLVEFAVPGRSRSGGRGPRGRARGTGGCKICFVGGLRSRQGLDR